MIYTPQFLWFDLETTCLDEHEGIILEAAAVVADDGPIGRMEPQEAYQAVLCCPGAMRRAEVNDFVLDMHTKNFLWAEAEESKHTLEEVDEGLEYLCRATWGRERVVLAGGSVHFDLRWAKRHLPKFASCLSHRVFDVSTLKQAERFWGLGFQDIKGESHRAMDDALASLAEAKKYRDLRYPS